MKLALKINYERNTFAHSHLPSHHISLCSLLLTDLMEQNKLYVLERIHLCEYFTSPVFVSAVPGVVAGVSTLHFQKSIDRLFETIFLIN